MEERDWLLCNRARAALGDLDAVLTSAIAANDLQLRLMASHVIVRGGKRLRPALLLLAASFGTWRKDVLLRAAAAVELTHVASLYHDDVMDRAPLRRSGPSTNATWGNAAACFAGTYLLARACDLWASVGHTASELASHAAVEMCAGQLREIENAFNLDQTESDHLSILERKTATLFEMPCRIGSLLSGAPAEWVTALASYGHELGVAFQLADDALDLTASTSQIGKATAHDLQQGVYSLPVLRAIRGTRGDELRAVLEHVDLDDDDVEIALRLIAESGTIPEVLDLARECVARAKAALAPLPRDTEAVQSLVRIADYAVERSH